MTEKEKIARLVSPEKFFPIDMSIGKLCGASHFIESAAVYLDILSESQFWPRSTLELIQLRRLKKLITKVSDYSNFWARYFKRYNISPDGLTSTADLENLPLLSRVELLKLGDNLYAPDGVEKRRLLTSRTSGTSGMPLKLIYSESEFILSHFPFHFRHPFFSDISLLKKLFSRKFAITLGMTGGRDYILNKDFVYHAFTNISSASLDNVSVRAVIYEKINEAAPVFLNGFASLISKFSQCLNEDKVKLPVFAVRISSESISSTERSEIERTFNASLINIFNSSGIGSIGFECPENKGRFHLNSEKAILEVVGLDGVPVEAGTEGEIIITALDYTVTPILRYAIDDIGRVVPGSSPCGRTLPIFEFRGRHGYDIVLPSGGRVGMIFLRSSLMDWWRLNRKAKQIQVIQKTPESIHILIVPKVAFNESDEVEMRLAVSKLFAGEKMLIEIVYVKNIVPGRGHKPSFFIPLSEFQERKL